MSHIDRTVTNEQVIPVFESTVFAADPRARLACGIIGVNGVAVSGREKEYAAHFLLRRHVYVDQTGQLSEADLREDGTDCDADDARSVTFGVCENWGEQTRLIGVVRLILRGAHALLPVEDFCPDVFAAAPASAASAEVSRMIARHESVVVQELVQWHLFAMLLAYMSNHGTDRCFAIIEPWLERVLKGMIAIDRIGEERFVEHYLDVNLPIEIDLPATIDVVNEKFAGLIDAHQQTEFQMRHFGRAPVLRAARAGVSA